MECEISGPRIGKFNKFSCRKLVIGQKTTVGNFNRITYMQQVIIGSTNKIKNNNSIIGTAASSPFKHNEVFIMGNGCTLGSSNHFDCADSVTIGSDVIIGGKDSQFWTHGFTNDRVTLQGPIVIEGNTYIGSRCLFMPSIRICTDNVIAAGTTVSKSISEPGVYVSSKLLRISDLKKLYDSPDLTVFNNRRYLRTGV